METKELIAEVLAQTLAPRLLRIFGKTPEEMGFPIYDTKEEVDIHIDRQFNPVEHWTQTGRDIAGSVLRILEAGGVDISNVSIDDALQASRLERPDMADHPASTE